MSPRPSTATCTGMHERRRAVILGGAGCVWRDLDAARRIGTYDAAIAINDAVAHYPGAVEIFATLHIEKAEAWLDERAARGYPPPGLIAAHKGNTNEGRASRLQADYVTDYLWPGMPASGSSGLFAVKVALEHGYGRIVLCGVPMRAEERHFFDPEPWSDVGKFTEAWLAALHRIRGHVRSMSGWTRELLGEPDSEWLAG